MNGLKPLKSKMGDLRSLISKRNKLEIVKMIQPASACMH